MRFRDYVRNTLGDLDNPEPQQQTSGKPRVQFDPQPEIVEFQEEAEYATHPARSRGGGSTITFRCER